MIPIIVRSIIFLPSIKSDLGWKERRILTQHSYLLHDLSFFLSLQRNSADTLLPPCFTSLGVYPHTAIYSGVVAPKRIICQFFLSETLSPPGSHPNAFIVFSLRPQHEGTRLFMPNMEEGRGVHALTVDTNHKKIKGRLLDLFFQVSSANRFAEAKEKHQNGLALTCRASFSHIRQHSASGV